MAAVAALFAALAVTGAGALPVRVGGSIDMTVTTDCAPWCGTLSSADAVILGAEGQRANGQFTGGGGASTSAIVGGGLLGKSATATATFEWVVQVYAPRNGTGEPFHLFLAWDATLFANHSVLGLGEAGGGSGFQATLYKDHCVLPGICVPFPTFHDERVFTASVFADGQWDLGLFDQSAPYQTLRIKFDVGSTATTYPVIGLYASAVDIGTLDFTLRADDGRAPPPPPDPVPETPTLALALAGLAALVALPRRRGVGDRVGSLDA